MGSRSANGRWRNGVALSCVHLNTYQPCQANSPAANFGSDESDPRVTRNCRTLRVGCDTKPALVAHRSRRSARTRPRHNLVYSAECRKHRPRHPSRVAPQSVSQPWPAPWLLPLLELATDFRLELPEIRVFQAERDGVGCAVQIAVSTYSRVKRYAADRLIAQKDSDRRPAAFELLTPEFHWRTGHTSRLRTWCVLASRTQSCPCESPAIMLARRWLMSRCPSARVAEASPRPKYAGIFRFRRT